MFDSIVPYLVGCSKVMPPGHLTASLYFPLHFRFPRFKFMNQTEPSVFRKSYHQCFLLIAATKSPFAGKQNGENVKKKLEKTRKTENEERREESEKIRNSQI
ncbi:hypothetical protein ACP275_14G204800 [Erythranthe tilingii]